MGSSAKELKIRIKSVDSTMHITRAMELVSSSKFKKAFDGLEKQKEYYSFVSEIFSEISAYATGESPFFRERSVKKSCYIIIAGDRGLAGGYNNNIFRLVSSLELPNGTEIIPIGKKAVEKYKNESYTLVSDRYIRCDGITHGEATEITEKLCNRFLKGEIDEVNVVYTSYKNMLSQEPVIKRVLPISKSEEKAKGEMIFEPSANEVLSKAVPDFVSALIYGAIWESIVSENAARRTAMDSAAKNAGDMIDALSLEYNRIRQGAITQEIAEIVAGAEH